MALGSWFQTFLYVKPDADRRFCQKADTAGRGTKSVATPHSHILPASSCHPSLAVALFSVAQASHQRHHYHRRHLRLLQPRQVKAAEYVRLVS